MKSQRLAKKRLSNLGALLSTKHHSFLKKNSTVSSGQSFWSTLLTKVTRWWISTRLKMSYQYSDLLCRWAPWGSTLSSWLKVIRAIKWLCKKKKTFRKQRRCQTRTLLHSLSCLSTLKSDWENWRLFRSNRHSWIQWRLKRRHRYKELSMMNSSSKSRADIRWKCIGA